MVSITTNVLQIGVVASQKFNRNTKFNNMDNDNLKTKSNNANVLLAVVSSEKEPENCLKAWSEKVCDNCEFVDYDMVGHPGGSSVHSVKKHYCKLGHWADDF